jgi:hypothetical protein
MSYRGPGRGPLLQGSPSYDTIVKLSQQHERKQVNCPSVETKTIAKALINSVLSEGRIPKLCFIELKGDSSD